MTTRNGGCSLAPFDSFNLGDHVQDDPVAVQANRAQLAAHLTAKPVFLQQVHGAHCERLSPDTPQGKQADACVTQHRRLACTVMVADCLPVLLCDRAGTTVGAAHAGWRGLVGAGEAAKGGVLPAVVRQLHAVSAPGGDGLHLNTEWLAWLGPCIGPTAFEVGAEVRAAFLNDCAHFASAAACFEAVWRKPGHYRCDLAALARMQLRALGIGHLFGNDSTADWCTVSQASLWFSHRRDTARLGGTGRMAACIWLD